MIVQTNAKHIFAGMTYHYRYRSFGDPPSQRAAEDIAYSVIRYFSKNGALVNYYMVMNLFPHPRLIKTLLISLNQKKNYNF